MESNEEKLTLSNEQNWNKNKINFFQDTETSNIIQSLANDNKLAIKNINDKITGENMLVEIQPEMLYNPYNDDYEDPF